MKNKLQISQFCILFFLICVACGKKSDSPIVEPPVLPVVTELPTVRTDTITGITSNAATVTATLVSKESSTKARGVCWDTLANPTVDKKTAQASSVSGSGEFSTAMTGLRFATRYFVRAYVTNATGTGYGKEMVFYTNDIQSATFAMEPMFIIGSTAASFNVNIGTGGGAAIVKRGFCYSTTANPTILSNVTADTGKGIGSFRGNLENLTPNTTYHIRAFATSDIGGTSYGTDSVFTTITKGNLTWTFNKSANPSTAELAAYARMQAAIDEAKIYMDKYTSYVKHVYLNYDAGVPTADANREGWMRFGASEGYQNTRTMLHELAHTIGSGTNSTWANSFIIGGVYQKPRANWIVNMITKGSTKTVNGDAQHFWPYGLNQNAEGMTHWDFVYHCMIVQGFKVDGLPN